MLGWLARQGIWCKGVVCLIASCFQGDLEGQLQGVDLAILVPAGTEPCQSPRHVSPLASGCKFEMVKTPVASLIMLCFCELMQSES